MPLLELRVARHVIARWNRRDVGGHRGKLPLLLGDVAADLDLLLHAHLEIGDDPRLALELLAERAGAALAIAQRLRHVLELLDALGEIPSVHRAG